MALQESSLSTGSTCPGHGLQCPIARRRIEFRTEITSEMATILELPGTPPVSKPVTLEPN